MLGNLVSPCCFERFKMLFRVEISPFFKKLGEYLDTAASRRPASLAAAAKPGDGKEPGATRIGYYQNDYYSNVDAHPHAEKKIRKAIEREWKGEIGRYVKMGGDKALFIDFIRAAKTGFPAERDRKANDIVKAFRDDFIARASEQDVTRIMKFHEDIRAKLQHFQDHSFVEGNERAYQEFSGRIHRLDCARRQLETILSHKSAALAAA
ncbi:hypothetical protein ACL598_11085 [Bordetella bronchialis]|uniref:hypothetical protein n=1 Tax=Bordetella bronchialis TaxID=463025 RepID=UPI003CFDD62A